MDPPNPTHPHYMGQAGEAPDMESKIASDFDITPYLPGVFLRRSKSRNKCVPRRRSLHLSLQHCGQIHGHAHALS